MKKTPLAANNVTKNESNNTLSKEQNSAQELNPTLSSATEALAANSSSDSSQAKIALNCSQKVLSHFAPQYGLDPSIAMRLATGFGGGMGRSGQTCGAVSAANLVLGLEYGSAQGEASAKELTYEKVQALQKQFIAKHGSYQCRELLQCDISTTDKFNQAKQQGKLNNCSNYIDDAIQLLTKEISG